MAILPYLQTYRQNVEDKAWSTLYSPPYYSKDGKSYLLVAPQRIGENGTFAHIVKVDLSKPDTSNSLEQSITLGSFEVLKILAWDEENNIM